jgi:hypothetical protein
VGAYARWSLGEWLRALAGGALVGVGWRGPIGGSGGRGAFALWTLAVAAQSFSWRTWIARA